MTTSISFDRAAGIYDRTRSWPPAVAEQGIQAILDAAGGTGARILDVGTGTGRISAPLLERGANLIGCDLSAKMMHVLRQKIPRARLAEADASKLPFAERQFDAVTTCHVMHLVGPWREALREYRRVLRPGGVYINARTEETDEVSPGKRIRDFWESCVARRGASTRRPGVQDDNELRAELLEMGARVSAVAVVSYRWTASARETIERIAGKTDSQTWVIPDEVLTATVQELREWAARQFKDIDAAFEGEATFILDIARFDSTIQAGTREETGNPVLPKRHLR